MRQQEQKTAEARDLTVTTIEPDMWVCEMLKTPPLLRRYKTQVSSYWLLRRGRRPEQTEQAARVRLETERLRKTRDAVGKAKKVHKLNDRTAARLQLNLIVRGQKSGKENKRRWKTGNRNK